jgi:hypothetical protein
MQYHQLRILCALRDEMRRTTRALPVPRLWTGRHPAVCGWCADPGQPAPRLTAQLTNNRHRPVIGTPSSVPTDRLSAADARVAHLRCRGLRLWHPGSAHRGVHGDTVPRGDGLRDKF